MRNGIVILHKQIIYALRKFTFVLCRQIPNFMKRLKTPDYRERRIFGVPLLVTLRRTGQPLPQEILHAMRSLRKTAASAVGIFRKTGMRKRIEKLRSQLESDPGKYTTYSFRD